MKKNYLLFIAASVALAFTACSTKEFDLPEDKKPGVTQEMKHISLSATTENDNNTKVTLVGTTYGWSAGVDKVKVTTTEGLVESEAYSAGHFELAYSGSRDGYAVVPSSFLTAAAGSNLTITYPSSYDISSYITDSYLVGGKYDAAGAYLPIPMIATSTEGESMLTFYALGALVRVTVSDVPVGTKKLYITFNQTVTGDFSVTSPTPGTSQVEVTDTSTPSTVVFTISDTGITAEQAVNSFVLYIPVPTTTTELGIASSSTTKATVARNMGYAWSVDAITRATSTTDFKIGAKNYIIAPGNLLASFDGEGNLSGWSFLDGNGGLDQLKTVISSTTNDPHVADDTTKPEWGTPNTVRDAFTWNRMYEVFMSSAPKGVQDEYISDDKEIEINGNKWRLPNYSEANNLWGVNGYDGRDGVLANVKGVVTKRTRVIVQVGGSSYDAYGITKYENPSGKKCIAGVLLFPDGYVDQTDILPSIGGPSHWSSFKPGISYAAFSKMIAAGAIFFPAAGYFSADSWSKVDDDSKGTAGVAFYLSATAVGASTPTTYLGIRASGNVYNLTSLNRSHYHSARLIRSVDIE